MSLKDRIEADYRNAFKAKNEIAIEALRLLKAAVKNAEIEGRKDFEDDEVIKVVTRESKKIKDSIDLYQKGNRTDLVERETEQLKTLAVYLPAQLGDAELRDIVSDVVQRLGAKSPADFGKVMKEVMTVTAGQADGTRVKSLVQELLAPAKG